MRHELQQASSLLLPSTGRYDPLCAYIFVGAGAFDGPKWFCTSMVQNHSVRRKITTRYAGEPEKVLLMRR